MGIKSLSNSSGIVNFQKHQSMLAGIELNKFHHLETVRLGSSVASVEFTNLGQYSDYQHLQLRYVARDNRNLSGTNNFKIYFNGDGSSSNYSYHFMFNSGSTVASTASTSQSQMLIGYVPMANDTADAYGAGVIDILDAFETSKYKTVRNLGGVHVSAGPLIILHSGLWFDTSAIDSITIPANTASWVAGTRFSLYGLKVRA